MRNQPMCLMFLIIHVKVVSRSMAVFCVMDVSPLGVDQAQDKVCAQLAQSARCYWRPIR